MKIKIEEEGKEKEYKLTVNWDDVTVAQYSQIVKTQQDKTLTEIEMSVMLVHILSGIDIDTIYSMDLEQLKEIIGNIKFINEPLQHKEVDFIELKTDKYYLKKDFDKLSVGEMISLQVIEEEMRKDNVNNIYAYLPKFLCIFLRKEDEMDKFKNEFMEREIMFGDCKIIQVNNLFTFFLSGEKV